MERPMVQQVWLIPIYLALATLGHPQIDPTACSHYHIVCSNSFQCDEGPLLKDAASQPICLHVLLAWVAGTGAQSAGPLPVGLTTYNEVGT